MAIDLATLVARLELQSHQFQSELGKANARLARFDRDARKTLSNVSKQLQGAFSAALFGISAGAFFGKLIEETTAAEAAFANLENAVQRNAGAAGYTAPRLAEIAGELQRITTYSDDAVMGVQALILRFRGISGPIVEDATRAILDLSAAMGSDLPSAARIVGRALENPEKGMKLLARAGASLSGSQQKLISDLLSAGKTVEAQQVILQELERRYGGAAEAARDTFGGALAGLKNAIGDLFEQKSGLPKLTKAINELTDSLGDPKTKENIDSLGGLLIGLLIGMKDFVSWASTPNRKQLEWFTDFLQSAIDKAREFKATFIDRTLAENLRIFMFTGGRGAPPTTTTPSTSGSPPPMPPPVDAQALDTIHNLIDGLEQQIATYERGAVGTIQYRIAQGDLADAFANVGEQAPKLQRELVALTAQYQLLQTKKLATDLQDQIATFDMSAAAAMRYRIEQGDLAATFAELGAQAGPLKDKLIELSAQLETKQATKQITDLTNDVSEQIALLDAGATATMRYRIEHGDLAKAFALAGEDSEKLKKRLLDLTLQLEIMTKAAQGAAEAVSDFAKQNEDSLSKGLESFTEDFEGRFLEGLDKLTVYEEQAARNTQDIIANSLVNGFDGGVKGILRSFGDMLRELIAQAVAADLAGRIFGEAGGGAKGSTGWLGMIAGIFGMSAKAAGGPVTAGHPYLVGERGPEVMVPARSGTIIPNDRLGGQTNYISVMVQAPTGRVPMETQQQVAARVAGALATARRRNG